MYYGNWSCINLFSSMTRKNFHTKYPPLNDPQTKTENKLWSEPINLEKQIWHRINWTKAQTARERLILIEQKISTSKYKNVKIKKERSTHLESSIFKAEELLQGTFLEVGDTCVCLGGMILKLSNWTSCYLLSKPRNRSSLIGRDAVLISFQSLTANKKFKKNLIFEKDSLCRTK